MPTLVAKPSQSCNSADNYCCGGCFLWRTCEGRRANKMSGVEYCQSGTKVVPLIPVRGVEDVTARTAKEYDVYWAIARKKLCSNPHCVILINSASCGRNLCFRTQHQMHIHARPAHGHDAKKWKDAVQKAACGPISKTNKLTTDWHPVLVKSRCSSAVARAVAAHGADHVFSQALGYAKTKGKKSLNDYTVVTWTSKCSGLPGVHVTLILLATGCSLEHTVLGPEPKRSGR